VNSPIAASRSLARSQPGILFFALMLGHMSQGLTFTAYIAALPQLAHALGANGELIAQMSIAIAALGTMTGALASGWVLEKAGTRTTMLVFLVVYGIAGTGGYVLRDPVTLLGSRFLVGFACVCMVIACVWGIAAEYTGDRRARALGASAALGSFTSLASTLLGGYLTEHAGWPNAFLQYPVFAVYGLVMVSMGLRQAKPELTTANQVQQPFFARMLPFYALASLISTVMFMGSTQFAFLLEEDGITNAGTRSLIMSGITIVSTLTSFGYGPIQQRLGALGAFVLSLACISAGLTSIGAGIDPSYAVLGAGFMGLYVGIVMPYIHHVVTERTDEFARSRALGVLNAFNFLGAFLNPLIFAPLAKQFGLRNVFLGTAVVMLVLCIGTAVNLLRNRGSAAQEAEALSH